MSAAALDPPPAVLTERRDAVLVITLNRPDARNAVNGALAAGLAQALESSTARASCRSACSRAPGAGSAPAWTSRPSSPARTCTYPGAASPASCSAPRRSRSWPRSRASRWPGGSRSRSPATSWWPREAHASVSPRSSAAWWPPAARCCACRGASPTTWRWSRAHRRAISAERAHELGLVNRLAEPGAALEVALELAGRVIVNAPLALAASKRILQEQWDWSADEGVDAPARDRRAGDALGRCPRGVGGLRRETRPGVARGVALTRRAGWRAASASHPSPGARTGRSPATSPGRGRRRAPGARATDRGATS